MKNTLIFAHFDKDNKIDDYVVYYLKELKKICQTIIFISDCNIKSEELSKLEGIADYIQAVHHGEYDFGSYKRGYLLAKKENILEETDNLLFVNDSCYGPFVSIKNIFNKMNAKECDFWGMTENLNYLDNIFFKCENSKDKHVQSYFLVLKKQVFLSNTFQTFIDNIRKQPNKNKIIMEYEIGLTKLLCNNNFTYNVYNKKTIAELNTIDIANPFEKRAFVLMKKSIITNICYWSIYKRKIKNKELLNFVEAHLKRTAQIQKLDINQILSYFLLELNYIRKYYIRIHMREKRIYLFGKWYTFTNTLLKADI